MKKVQFNFIVLMCMMEHLFIDRPICICQSLNILPNQTNMPLTYVRKYKILKMAKFWCAQQRRFSSNFYKTNKQKHCRWMIRNKLNAINVSPLNDYLQQGNLPLVCCASSMTLCFNYKQLSYGRGTARARSTISGGGQFEAKLQIEGLLFTPLRHDAIYAYASYGK